jgi:hypothetical protein
MHDHRLSAQGGAPVGVALETYSLGVRTMAEKVDAVAGSALMPCANATRKPSVRAKGAQATTL